MDGGGQRGPDTRDLSNAFVVALFSYLERAGGPALVEEVVGRADPSSPTAELLEGPWVSRDDMVRLAAAAADLTGEREIGRRTGEELFRICNQNEDIKGYLIAAGAPASSLDRLLAYTGNLGRGRLYHLVSLTDEDMVVEGDFVPRESAHPFFCELILGFWPQVPSLFGSTGVAIHPTCQVRGDDICRFVIRWDADAATENLEARAQRDKLIYRMESFEDMQMMAAQLARATDLPALSEKILDAIDVIMPAPGILAAIRGQNGDRPIITCRGLAPEIGQVVGAELLEGTYDGRLGLAISSDMGPLGVIAAIISREEPVSEIESRRLAAFAGHANARLEALLAERAAEESRRTASALLKLARSLSATVTEQEVCERIVQAIPGLMRSDTSAVLRWSSDDHTLHPVAVSGPGNEAPYSEVTVKDAPDLLDLAAHPVPFLLEPTTCPPAIAAAMQEWGDALDVVVPLIEQGEFLGLLCAGYRETLTLDRETAFERLQGVADLATPVLSKTRLLDEVRHQALHDALTGLPNRVLLEATVRDVLAGPKSRDLTLLFIDLDRFKTVNDSLGHDFGDMLIRQAATRVGQALRPDDTLARVGGDEFVVVLPGVADARAAEKVAERILEQMGPPFQLADQHVYVSASIGVAVCPATGSDYATLLQEADGAMYAAKAAGRGRVASHPSGSSGGSVTRLTLESELHRAFDDDQISVLFQPQVALGDLMIGGAEALVRWEHPRLGQLPPSEFIPIAEDCALLPSLDRHVRRLALAQVAELRRTVGPLVLALNLSGQSLARPNLVAEILADLAEAGVDPDTVEIEVTEDAVGDDLIPVVRRMADAGLRIAVDDFGIGASGFARLQSFPLHTLKIDRSLVQGSHPARDGAILGAIITMAHDLGLSVVAEGVETPVHAGQLRRARCDHAQGFLFGRPMPVVQLGQLVCGQRPQFQVEALAPGPVPTGARH